MKWLISVCTVLAVAACGSSTSSTTGTTGTTATTSGTGSTTGAASTTHGATTGTASTTGTHGTSGTTTTTSSSTSGGLAYGASCTLGSTDPCAATGYECDAQFSGAASGTCVLPAEFGSCTTAVGCAGDAGFTLSCTTLTSSQGTQTTCLEPCTTTTGCSDSITSCQSLGGTGSSCYFNLCPSTAAPYTLCDAGGSNDGQCLPEPDGTGSTVGVCFQTGLVASYGVCGNNRGGPLCTADNLCLGPLSDGLASCYPLCDTTATGDAGEQCSAVDTDAGLSCLSVSSTLTWGICGQQCMTGDTCFPSAQTCNATDGICEP